MAEKPGLQIERTHLSWERSTISILAVTGLLMFPSHSPIVRARPALALVSIVLALVVFGISRSRGRIKAKTDRNGRSVVPAPQTAVPLVGWATAGLATLILIAMLVGM